MQWKGETRPAAADGGAAAARPATLPTLHIQTALQILNTDMQILGSVFLSRLGWEIIRVFYYFIQNNNWGPMTVVQDVNDNKIFIMGKILLCG